jgi:hypothetical protein
VDRSARGLAEEYLASDDQPFSKSADVNALISSRENFFETYAV